jgi:hypothetical protein
MAASGPQPYWTIWLWRRCDPILPERSEARAGGEIESSADLGGGGRPRGIRQRCAFGWVGQAPLAEDN